MDRKWINLSLNMGHEPGILAGRNSAEELESHYAHGHAAVVEMSGEIVGFGALFPTTHPAWLELGSMFVHQDHRGKKISSEIFHRCLALVAPPMHVLVVTHHPKVVHHCVKAQLYEAPCTKAPEPPDTIVCGPCDRVSDQDKPLCPFRNKRNKCAVFFR